MAIVNTDDFQKFVLEEDLLKELEQSLTQKFVI